jgi:E3 ubiquitin-protein ligase UHRF1
VLIRLCLQNKELLASLGFDKPTLEPKEKKRTKKPLPPKKRKISESELSSNESEPQTESSTSKAPRVQLSETAPEGAVRRSSRNAGKVVDYKKEIIKDSPVPVAYLSGVKSTENTGPMGRESGKRKYDPYVSHFIHSYIQV